MSNLYEDALVQCPYYRYDRDGCIHCEGITADSTLRLGFGAPHGRMQHKRTHCHRAWTTCAIAQMQNARYGYEP